MILASALAAAPKISPQSLGALAGSGASALKLSGSFPASIADAFLTLLSGIAESADIPAKSRSSGKGATLSLKNEHSEGASPVLPTADPAILTQPALYSFPQIVTNDLRGGDPKPAASSNYSQAASATAARCIQAKITQLDATPQLNAKLFAQQTPGAPLAFALRLVDTLGKRPATIPANSETPEKSAGANPAIVSTSPQVVVDDTPRSDAPSGVGPKPSSPNDSPVPFWPEAAVALQGADAQQISQPAPIIQSSAPIIPDLTDTSADSRRPDAEHENSTSGPPAETARPVAETHATAVANDFTMISERFRLQSEFIPTSRNPESDTVPPLPVPAHVALVEPLSSRSADAARNSQPASDTVKASSPTASLERPSPPSPDAIHGAAQPSFAGLSFARAHAPEAPRVIAAQRSSEQVSAPSASAHGTDLNPDPQPIENPARPFASSSNETLQPTTSIIDLPSPSTPSAARESVGPIRTKYSAPPTHLDTVGLPNPERVRSSTQSTTPNASHPAVMPSTWGQPETSQLDPGTISPADFDPAAPHDNESGSAAPAAISTEHGERFRNSGQIPQALKEPAPLGDHNGLTVSTQSGQQTRLTSQSSAKHASVSNPAAAPSTQDSKAAALPEHPTDETDARPFTKNTRTEGPGPRSQLDAPSIPRQTSPPFSEPVRSADPVFEKAKETTDPRSGAAVPDLPAVNTVHHAAAIKDISVRVASNESQPVDLRFVDREGSIRVAVRTPDADLARNMQTGLNDLVQRLEHKGFQTETWSPAAIATRTHNDSAQGERTPNGNGGGSFSSSAGDQQAPDRQNGRHRPKWVTELDQSLSAEQGGNAS